MSENLNRLVGRTADATGRLAVIGLAPAERRGTYFVLFMLFFGSGFCSLLYQVVWLRMAFAHFGIITPVLSVVLSVFMLGLGVGAFVGGRWAPYFARALKISPAWLYGGAELIIGLGAFAVPVLFRSGEGYLLAVGAAGSGEYLLLSALFIAAALLPWCVMMGATFPLMMAFVRQFGSARSSFSFLYLANVIGAMTGTIASAIVLVELFGFARTSMVAAIVNFTIAAVSFVLAWRNPAATGMPAEPKPDATEVQLPGATARGIEIVLFTTGFCSLAMEVVWTRAFTFVLQTTIYAFAMILATYLLATWIGSAAYRFALARGLVMSTERILAWLSLFVFLPVVLDDPNVQHTRIIVLASIAPFCAALGYLTPKLVDEYSRGHPDRMGRCYGINILGGILGPLFAGYCLLPFVDVRVALLVLAAPMLLLAVAAMRSSHATATRWLAIAVPVGALLFMGCFASRSYEEGAYADGPREVHRDHVATAIAYGAGMSKGLLVNGVGITVLTPITKIIAHLPLALHGNARTGLVICFGMGTTFRSMHSWGIETTTVDLTRSVIDAFGFFHADAAEIAADPRARIVVDDGRRYLLRTDQKFDVIVLDPPPPVEAAGSSLLYSEDFYKIAKLHLQPGGILQQWLPPAENRILQAVALSLTQSFPYVVAYQSIENTGYHFLASMTPIPTITAAQFVARMPESARRDLTEWSHGVSAEALAENILGQRRELSTILADRVGVIAITDDRPYNEYFILRRHHLTNW